MRFLCFLLVVPFFVHAQQAVIKGVAPLAIGQEIQLRVNQDPISGKERILAKQIVDVDGSFELTIKPSSSVQYAMLQVGQNCADFFIEPNKDLELSFVPPPKDPKLPRAFYQRFFFTPKVLGGESALLNQQIVQFNDTLDAFLEALYPALMNRKSPAVVDRALNGFEKEIQQKITAKHPFVKQYIRFAIATVEQTFARNRAKLYEKYLKETNPQFNNPTYVDFLLQFYQGTVYQMAAVNRVQETKQALKTQQAFAKLDQMLLELEPQLDNLLLRRLILIKGLDELFGQREFEEQQLINALVQFASTASHSQLQAAASNIAIKHQKLANGSPAPDILFTDLNGTTKHLSEFEGGYVFLELTDATNAYCQRETNVVANLKQEFKNIRFVTVCVGNTQAQMRALQKQMNIDWEFGGVAISSSLIDDYNIKSLPLFFIIDPEGRFYRVPAKDPTKGAQGQLMTLTEKLKAEGRRGVGR